MSAACLLHDHGLSQNVKVTNVMGGLPSVHLTPRDGDVTDHVTSIDWSPLAWWSLSVTSHGYAHVADTTREGFLCTVHPIHLLQTKGSHMI